MYANEHCSKYDFIESLSLSKVVKTSFDLWNGRLRVFFYESDWEGMNNKLLCMTAYWVWLITCKNTYLMVLCCFYNIHAVSWYKILKHEKRSHQTVSTFHYSAKRSLFFFDNIWNYIFLKKSSKYIRLISGILHITRGGHEPSAESRRRL